MINPSLNNISTLNWLNPGLHSLKLEFQTCSSREALEKEHGTKRGTKKQEIATNILKGLGRFLKTRPEVFVMKETSSEKGKEKHEA